MIWNKHICGDVAVSIVHDGLSSNFLTSEYTYDSTAANRLVKLLPTLNTEIGIYSAAKLKIYLAEYTNIEVEVPFSFEVLPCEIKSRLETFNFTDPVTYVLQDPAIS